MDDLVWPSNKCDCPQCRCDTLDTSGTGQEVNEYGLDFTGPTKTCYNCTCTKANDTTDLVYSCNESFWTYEPLEWNHFQCPPMECKDSNETVRRTGSRWFENVLNGTECNEYCFCSASQGTICETGWSNIMQNEALFDVFHDECAYGYCPYTIGVE